MFSSLPKASNHDRLRSPLILAVQLGNYDMAQRLLEFKVSQIIHEDSRATCCAPPLRMDFDQNPTTPLLKADPNNGGHTCADDVLDLDPDPTKLPEVW